MGGGSSTSQNKKKQKQTTSTYQEGYIKSFQFFKQNKQSIETHFIQNLNFSKNLSKFFPQFYVSQTHFLEMVMYLRKYDPKIVHNKQALVNIKNTTLLDRFFMICLGNISCQTYYSMELSLDQIESLLLDYYSLFIKNPSKGTLPKILKFMKLQETQKMNPKKFAQSFRQFFPHVQKHLKDYYYKKIYDKQKQFRILQNFQSKILLEDAVLLASKQTPQVAKLQITELYNSQKFGIGFHSIQKKLIGYTAPWLLLIQHSQKDQNGNRVKYVFGTYQNGPIKDVSSPQSDLTAFMFSIQPTIKFMTTDKGQGGNNYFFINNVDEKISKRRKGFGFGGNQKKQDCKLWIDQDMDKSKVFNGNDHTYGYGYLASPGTSTLYVKRMQVWGLGNAENLKQQAEYWSDRYQQINKRRKVNKKDFVDSNAGLFFQNTFAHRQQVVGQIQKKQEDKEHK